MIARRPFLRRSLARRSLAAAALVLAAGALGACGDDEPDEVPPTVVDADVDGTDVEDTEPEDSEVEDTEPEDTEPEDSEPDDTEPEDSGPEESGPDDTGAALAADCAVLDEFFTAANGNELITADGPLTAERVEALESYVDDLERLDLETDAADDARGELADLLDEALDDATHTDDLVVATLDGGEQFQAFNDDCAALPS